MPIETERMEFQWNVHSYLNEYIRFADSKSQIVVGWTSAILGALFATGIQKQFEMSTRGVLTVIGVGLLVVGFICAIIAVTPRLKTDQLPGLIFWKSILAHKDRAKFVAATKGATNEDLITHISEHTFDLAKIADNKFWWTGIAIVSSFVGSLISGAMYATI